MGIIPIKRSHRGFAITTKDSDDNKLIEPAIKDNERMADLKIREPEKRWPRVINYNVSKDINEEDIHPTVERSGGDDVKVVFKMERRNGNH